MTPDRALAEEREAVAYAALILAGSQSWEKVNREIIERWSKSALLRVKYRAWQIVEKVAEVYSYYNNFEKPL